QGRAFWAVADDRQPRLRIEHLQSVNQNVDSLVGNKASGKNQITRPRSARALFEHAIVVGISNANGRSWQRLGDRAANGERSRKSQKEAFRAMRPTDPPI